MPQYFSESELILNPTGTIYHLDLLPEELADNIIFVGDPNRVPLVSQHFDNIEVKKQKRELVTHTGWLNGKRLTVLSTGMSTANIDIVLTELDALANIDFESRTSKDHHRTLDIVRIGTAGGLQEDLGNDYFLLSTAAIGMDGLMSFYDFHYGQKETALLNDFQRDCRECAELITPYVAFGSDDLLERFSGNFEDFNVHQGITVTCNGFYAPQGRQLRGKAKMPDFLDRMSHMKSDVGRITNFEMETAGIYGLGTVLGHRCLSVSAVVANRVKGTFSTQFEKTLDGMIRMALERF